MSRLIEPRRSRFPNPRYTPDDGLVSVGGKLDVATLVDAYWHGIFPWPQEGYPMLWFSPKERGILEFDELHWPKRFLRTLKSQPREITFDRAFERVVEACAEQKRSHETGTWILPEMQKAYVKFHEAGYAHSIEAWRDGELVGGLYGVFVGGVFSGESMFFRESDAGKRCLYAVVEALKSHGVKWMDIQMVTPVLKSLGGKYISRSDFLDRVRRAKSDTGGLSWDEIGKASKGAGNVGSN